MRRTLPVLQDGPDDGPDAGPDALDLVEIPIPCDVPWEGMPGDEQVRHCGQCKQNVYNVSELTRAEANRLLRARACLRIYRRPDNTVITSDCRARLRAARKRGLLIFAGTLLIVLWAQICAQFVGVMGLRRLLGGGRATMGEPRPVPGQVARPAVKLPAIDHTMEVPEDDRFTMGEPPPPPPKPRKHLAGKPLPPKPVVMGRGPAKMGKLAIVDED